MRVGSAYLPRAAKYAPRKTAMVKARITRCSAMALRIRSPAPTRSMSVSASSPAIRAVRRRSRTPPAARCALLPSASSRHPRDRRASRARGRKANAQTIDVISVNPRTKGSRLVRRGVESPAARRRPARGYPTTRAQARGRGHECETTLSVRSCRTMRPRPAPSAVRTASSAARAAPAREQKVRDIAACDEQDESDRAEQDEQPLAIVADDLGHDRREREPASRVVTREVLLERFRRPRSTRRAPGRGHTSRADGRRP